MDLGSRSEEKPRMEIMRSSVLVVIAAFNEAEGIGPTLQELNFHLSNPHLMVVDGKSHDRTAEIAKDMGADVIFDGRKGKGNALHRGIKELDSRVRYVVFIDADFTYPAKYVPEMIETLEREPNVGMVIGDRFNGEVNLQKSWTNPFYLGNRLIALAQHAFNGIRLNDPLSGLRVVRAEVLRNWKPKSQGFDIEAEINFLVEREGYRILELPIDYRPRLGNKKLKLRHGIWILKRIIAESLAM